MVAAEAAIDMADVELLCYYGYVYMFEVCSLDQATKGFANV